MVALPLALPLALTLPLFATPTSADAFDPPPSAELIGQLRERLLAPPECRPGCTAIARMALQVRADTLRLRLEIDVLAESALPLPGELGDWLPRSVTVDERPAEALRLQGESLWLHLSPGRHQVLLEGPLPAGEGIQLPLPLRPHHVTLDLDGWRVDGVHENGLSDGTLQLTRLGRSARDPQEALVAETLPPFVQVERTFVLGLTWQLETHVKRLSPLGSAVVLAVPLLAGESVTTPELHVQNGQALVNMGPQEELVSWTSTLVERPAMTLHAPASTNWVETWQMQASPIWHLEARGIPPVQPEQGGSIQGVWRPWPGETLELSVSRPGGAAGPTLTIDRSSTQVRPGRRATDTTLELQIRSSRGGQHALALPQGAVLEAVAIDGAPRFIRQQATKVTLPIHPGRQHVRISWQEARRMDAFYRVSSAQLGAPSVNATTLLTMPDNRWVLFAGGGGLMGPAVLFWSTLCVLLIVALALGKVRLTPLRTTSWALLGIGLATLPAWSGAIVAGWLLFCGWRERTVELGGRRRFNLRQVLIVSWGLLALAVLVAAVYQGLLGPPSMQIGGNGSSAGLLRWYTDRAGVALPSPWVVSAPIYVYRLFMLAWALWLAWSLLAWLRWSWSAFNRGGIWLRKTSEPAPAVDPASQP